MITEQAVYLTIGKLKLIRANHLNISPSVLSVPTFHSHLTSLIPSQYLYLYNECMYVCVFAWGYSEGGSPSQLTSLLKSLGDSRHQKSMCVCVCVGVDVPSASQGFVRQISLVLHSFSAIEPRFDHWPQ